MVVVLVLRSCRVVFERGDSVLSERRRGRELGEKVCLASQWMSPL
jgi:hypothetical protein